VILPRHASRSSPQHELGPRRAIEHSDETIYDRFVEAQRLHLEWLSGRGADEAPSFSTDDLKPQSLFLPGKLGDVLRRGGKDKT